MEYIISTSANTTDLRIASSKTSDKETEKHKTQKTQGETMKQTWTFKGVPIKP